MYLISSSNSRQVYRDLFYIGISWFIAKLNGLTIALFSNTKPSCLENCQHCTFCLALSQNLKISKKILCEGGFKKKVHLCYFLHISWKLTWHYNLDSAKTTFKYSALEFSSESPPAHACSDLTIFSSTHSLAWFRL